MSTMEAMNAKSNKPLLPAYLVVGEDALKRRTVIERLRTRVAQEGSLEFNHDEFDGEKASGSDIVGACNTLPFASSLRLVEVTNAEKLAKADSEALVAYLAIPNESTVLAIMAEKLAKNTRLYKAVNAIGSTAVIDCTPPKRYELVKNVRAMAVGRGFTMNDSAAQKLVELVGEDTVRIDNELRKIALAHQTNDAVTEREVERLVARTSEAKPWEFVDAFSARDARRCLRLLPLLPSSSPYALIAMCTNRLRELICARSLSQRGEAGRIAETLKMPAWRCKNHVAWARGFAPGALERALVSARDCERAMKSGSNPDEAFLNWVLSIVA